MAEKMRRNSPTLHRRLAEAEVEIARRVREHGVDVLAAAINASTPEINRAIEMRLRSLWVRQAEDPAWSDSDPVRTILLSVFDVAPDLASRVAMVLGIELTPGGVQPQ
jgi:hypothetical protein